MGSKVRTDYDPYAAFYANAIKGQADKISGLASGYETTSDLTDIGKSELGKIKAGRYGDTMMAGVAQDTVARDLQRLKESFRLGTNAMRKDGPNSLLSHERQLRAAQEGSRGRAASALIAGLPGYTAAVGDWADTNNRLLSQRINAEGAAAGVLGNAAGVMNAGRVVTEKKSFWDKFKDVASFGLSAAKGAMALSDERAKRNVQPVLQRKAAEKIKALHVKDYQYKPGYADEGKHTGVVAQQVEKAMPEAVKTGPDGLKRVDMASIFAANVAATQHALNRQDKLERAMQGLQGNQRQSNITDEINRTVAQTRLFKRPKKSPSLPSEATPRHASPVQMESPTEADYALSLPDITPHRRSRMDIGEAPVKDLKNLPAPPTYTPLAKEKRTAFKGRIKGALEALQNAAAVDANEGAVLGALIGGAVNPERSHQVKWQRTVGTPALRQRREQEEALLRQNEAWAKAYGAITEAEKVDHSFYDTDAKREELRLEMKGEALQRKDKMGFDERTKQQEHDWKVGDDDRKYRHESSENALNRTSAQTVAQIQADTSRQNNIRTNATSRQNNLDTNANRLKTSKRYPRRLIPELSKKLGETEGEVEKRLLENGYIIED